MGIGFDRPEAPGPVSSAEAAYGRDKECAAGEGAVRGPRSERQLVEVIPFGVSTVTPLDVRAATNKRQRRFPWCQT